MSIPDLRYPEDAIRVVDSLLRDLRYDASVATLGVKVHDLPAFQETSNTDVRYRVSGEAEDLAVQRDAPRLLARYSLLLILSHFERHVGQLLLQRRVLEHLVPDKRMQPGEMWSILKRVHQESRPGPVRVAYEMVVTSPSAKLAEMKHWLEGLYAVRNCLAHRDGAVELIDVAPLKGKLELTSDEDRLKATWLRVTITSAGIPVDLPFKHQGDDLGIAFIPYSREWNVGDQIDVTASEIQGICMALSFLAHELLRCFVAEMDVIVGLRPQS